MKRQYYGSENLEVEEEESFKLDYYMLQNMKKYEEFEEEKLIYGIQIIKENNGRELENSYIEDITVNKSEIEKLINSLKINKVTPIHLYEIVDDFLNV